MSSEYYVRRLDKNRFRNLLSAVGPGSPMTVQGREIPEAEFVRANPKIAIWMAGTYALAFIYLHGESVQLQDEPRRARESFGESFLRLREPSEGGIQAGDGQ